MLHVCCFLHMFFLMQQTKLLFKRQIISIFLGFLEHVLVLLRSSVMQFQEWLRSLFSHAETKVSESDDLWTLLPSLPSLSLSTSSLLGLGALASLAVCWLVTRPRPMSPLCDLQAQSVAVGVSASLQTAAFKYLDGSESSVRILFVCREIRAAGGPL